MQAQVIYFKRFCEKCLVWPQYLKQYKKTRFFEVGTQGLRPWTPLKNLFQKRTKLFCPEQLLGKGIFYVQPPSLAVKALFLILGVLSWPFLAKNALSEVLGFLGCSDRLVSSVQKDPPCQDLFKNVFVVVLSCKTRPKNGRLGFWKFWPN